MLNIKTPKLPYFSTLLSAYCTHTEEAEAGAKVFHLELPTSDSAKHLVVLTKTSHAVHDSYTWQPNTEEVFARLLQLNARVVHLSHIQAWCSDCLMVSVLAMGDIGPIIEVSINSIDRPLLYTVQGTSICCTGSGPKHAPVGAPNEYTKFHAVFSTATHVQCFLNRPDRSLSHEDALSIYKALSSTDKNLLNSYWRFIHMDSNTQSSTSFTSDQIVSFALYLGVSRDKYKPFAMISAIKIYQEDKDLFRPCISLGNAVYTAIGNPKLRSKVIIDEMTFLQIVRENPTCKTVCNIMFCLSLKLNGQGLYFDMEEYLG